MLKKFASLMLVFALICTLVGPSALASTPSDPESKPRAVGTSTESSPVTRSAAKLNEKLRADVRKLADARAGQVAPAARSQIQPARSNNLSTKAKVAIGVGIAVIVLALVVNHARKHFFDCKSRCVI